MPRLVAFVYIALKILQVYLVGRIDLSLGGAIRRMRAKEDTLHKKKNLRVDESPVSQRGYSSSSTSPVRAALAAVTIFSWICEGTMS